MLKTLDDNSENSHNYTFKGAELITFVTDK